MWPTTTVYVGDQLQEHKILKRQEKGKRVSQPHVCLSSEVYERLVRLRGTKISFSDIIQDLLDENDHKMKKKEKEMAIPHGT